MTHQPAPHTVVAPDIDRHLLMSPQGDIIAGPMVAYRGRLYLPDEASGHIGRGLPTGTGNWTEESIHAAEKFRPTLETPEMIQDRWWARERRAWVLTITPLAVLMALVVAAVGQEWLPLGLLLVFATGEVIRRTVIRPRVRRGPLMLEVPGAPGWLRPVPARLPWDLGDCMVVCARSDTKLALLLDAYLEDRDEKWLWMAQDVVRGSDVEDREGYARQAYQWGMPSPVFRVVDVEQAARGPVIDPQIVVDVENTPH